MSDKETFSPQGWLDWQLKSLDGYKDLDKLNRLLISAESTIDLDSGRVKQHAPLVAAGLLKSDQLDKYQDELEWALELKTLIEKEIADFPPLPVLPPPGPLEKISGVVEEVTLTKAMACFDAEAYSTMKDELERKRNRDNAGAAIAMVAQTLSGTAPHALINDGKANKLKCLYVKGKISGKSFSGWFGMTDITLGDYVEMAIMPKGDDHIAYAIVNPKQRTISLTPKCNRDGKLYSFHVSMLGSFLFMFFPFFIFGIFATDFRLWVLFWFVTFSTVFGVYMFKTNKRDYGPSCLLFQRIKETLDLKPELDFRKIMIQKKKDNAFTSRIDGERISPQIDSDYIYEYFYYY
ncbi:hypothetical protein MUU49_11740 [Scandinavium goeteborgense]|uniref:putative type VI secretion system effector n=1 Tax=Scandinavium goeteborgense TaxID=1851514 RepID=UPI00216506D5|nr:putative type VI secretion system effector [Scandinavium goeteborgense]MCS2153236.1 hypothetical protein [Scandinavium goeteborgense]